MGSTPISPSLLWQRVSYSIPFGTAAGVLFRFKGEGMHETVIKLNMFSYHSY